MNRKTGHRDAGFGDKGEGGIRSAGERTRGAFSRSECEPRQRGRAGDKSIGSPAVETNSRRWETRSELGLMLEFTRCLFPYHGSFEENLAMQPKVKRS
jgi:hypothetical protein